MAEDKDTKTKEIPSKDKIKAPSFKWIAKGDWGSGHEPKLDELIKNRDNDF